MSFQEITISETQIEYEAVLESCVPPLQIYFFEINAFEDKLAFFKTILTKEEIERSQRYIHATDANRFITTRALLRILLSKSLNCKAESIVLQVDANKKPSLLFPEMPIHFSVSHTKKFATIAICYTNVGVDIEYINNEFNYVSIISIIFSDLEQDFVRHSSNPIEAFFLLWTRKESLLKASGIGITDNLVNVPSLNGVHLAELQGTIHAEQEVVSFQANAEVWLSVCFAKGMQIKLHNLKPEHIG